MCILCVYVCVYVYGPRCLKYNLCMYVCMMLPSDIAQATFYRLQCRLSVYSLIASICSGLVATFNGKFLL